MIFKISKYILGIFDLIIVVNVLNIGISMIRQIGNYAEYPIEWLARTPFESYVLPGIIGILIFGLGNLMATYFAITSSNSKSWIISAIMACVLFLAMQMQMIILGESYMATVILFLISVVQLALSGITAVVYKFHRSANKRLHS